MGFDAYASRQYHFAMQRKSDSSAEVVYLFLEYLIQAQHRLSFGSKGFFHQIYDTQTSTK